MEMMRFFLHIRSVLAVWYSS